MAATSAPDRATARRVLDTALPENDAGAATVRDYLVALAAGVWREGEGFSGKRPFGDSGWRWELYEGLAKAGLIATTFDEDGHVDRMPDGERVKADALVAAGLIELGRTDHIDEPDDGDEDT